MASDNMMKATYKAGYMDGHAAGYQKATEEFDMNPRIMDALAKGFLDGWQVRQKDIDELEEQYDKLVEQYRLLLLERNELLRFCKKEGLI